MKRFIRNTTLFLIPVIAVYSYIVYYNIQLDPFAVIHQDMSTQYIEPNQRWLKTHFLLDHHTQFDSYIFGSSRAGKIDPRNIHDGGAWYNFSYSEGLPVQHTEDLRILIASGAQIKKVLVGLDNISFSIHPSKHRSQAPRKGYKNRHDPYLDYFFLTPDKKIKNQIETVKASPYQVVYDIEQTGMPDASFRDQWIINDKEKHCNHEKFDEPTWAFYYQPRVNETIAEIDDLIALCKDNKIELIFYLGPMHHRTYVEQSMDPYFEFMRQLAQRTIYYDFSGLNRITTDNYYYYETSHFRPMVGDIMTRILFEKEDADFGQWVGPENIEQVIEGKREQWNKWLK